MKRFKKFLWTTLIGGVVIILPITIVIFLVNLILRFVNNLLRPLANLISSNHELDKIVVNILALAIVISFCFIVGLFVRTRFGNNIWKYIEMEWLSKLPFYNVVKETVQQFAGNKKMPFKQVVLVDPFGNGTTMTGFITDEDLVGRVTVFVPTAPNPTNGFVFHVPADQITKVDTDPEDALRTIIAVGVGSADVLETRNEQEKEPVSKNS